MGLRNWGRSVLLVGIMVSGLPVLAQPEAAEVTFPETATVVHLGTYHVASDSWSAPASKGAGPVPIWATSEPSGLFFPVSNTTRERINSGDLPEGTLISRFTIGFTTDSSMPVGASLAFYNTDLFDTQTGLLQRADGSDAVYALTFPDVDGTPGEQIPYNVTIDLTGGAEVVITGPDVDGDGKTDWGWGSVYDNLGNATIGCSGFPCLGPRLAGVSTPPGATGSQNRWDAFDPAAWTGGVYQETLEFPTEFPPGTNFIILEGQIPTVVDIPTLSQVGLLVLILGLGGFGMVALRRRSEIRASRQ